MQQQIGVLQLFQGGLEGAQERFGQGADEADRIGDDNLPFAGETQAAGGGVQGGEEQVFGKDLAPGQGVEQGGFAGIGVTDDGDDRHAGLDPLAAALVAAPGELLQLPLQAGDAVTDTTAVGLQFGLARSAPTDAAHQPRHLHTPPGQARQQIFELGQFHLDLAVQAFGPAGKDIEDQLAAIDDLQFGHGSDGTDLGRRQFLVENQHGGAPLEGSDDNVAHLALTHQEAGVEIPRALDEAVQGFNAGGPGQFAQFGDGILGLLPCPAGGDRDQDGALNGISGMGSGARGTFQVGFQLGDEMEAVQIDAVERRNGLGNGRGTAIGRGKMGYLCKDLLPGGGNEQGGQKVETQQREVGNVVFADRLVLEVGMDQAQPPQRMLAQRVVAQLGYDEPLFIANDNIFHHALAVDQDTDLAADVGGYLDETGGQLGGAELGRRDAPPVEAFQRLDLALFESCEITVRFFDGKAPTIYLQADHVIAAVHVVYLAGHSAGHVAAQVEGGAGHVLLGDGAAQGGLGLDVVEYMNEAVHAGSGQRANGSC